MIRTSSDYKTGFGGQFGVQTDRVDKNAVGWEHNEKVGNLQFVVEQEWLWLNNLLLDGSTMKRLAMDFKFLRLWLNKNAVGWVCNLRFFVELKIFVSSLSSMKAKARRATTRAGSWHRQIQILKNTEGLLRPKYKYK